MEETCANYSQSTPGRNEKIQGSRAVGVHLRSRFGWRGSLHIPAPVRTPLRTKMEFTNFYGAAITASLLHAGTNVMAVEIHQFGTNSSDLSFDLELTAQVTVAAPQLQSAFAGGKMILS